MKKEEFNEKKEALLNEYEAKRKALYKEYAFANNPYNIGDVVTDYSGSVRVEKIQFHSGLSSYPQCVYTGPWLKKDGTPNKKNETRAIYQENII